MPEDLPAPRAKSIFLSYRRDDSEEVVDRIYETLSAHLSEDALFRDVDDIEPGANFPKVIRERLRDCDVVLVFIGRDWLTAQLDGRPRLNDPNDHLRQEIQAALAHPYAQLIPVLVKHATMPTADQLPVTLRPLAEINAKEVRSRGKEYLNDVAALAAAIRKGILVSQTNRQIAAERESEQGHTGTARDEGITAPALESRQWNALISAAREHGLVVVCGSEFGTDRKRGDPRCREYAIAAQVAMRLNLEIPPIDARRPLAQLAVACHRSGQRDAFAHELGKAAQALGPASGLSGLATLEPFRRLVTSALDRGLEVTLEARASQAVESVNYTRGGPLALDGREGWRSGGLVLHAAGYAGGLDGDAAVTDVEWREFAAAWRDRMPERLESLFEGSAVLFSGAGSPAGFIESWVDLAARLRCHSLWIGSSTLADDAAGTRSLGEAEGPEATLFDDTDGAAFLEEFERRWLSADEPRAAEPSQQRKPAASAASGTQRAESPSPASIPRPDQASPWPGLAPYTEVAAGLMFGRERESDQVVQSVAVHPVTVLYARSGLGKTSLLHAGVAPRLRERRLIPILIRVTWTASSDLPLSQQVLGRVSEAAASAGLVLPPPTAEESLWSYFHRRDVAQASDQDGRTPFVLMFDQFEELFTMGAMEAGSATRAGPAVRELADLVECHVPDEIRDRVRQDVSVIETFDVRLPAPHVLIAIREDFLPDLNGLGHLMPSIKKSGIRILGLSLEAARAVLIRAGGGIFEPDAASALLASLAKSDSPDFVGQGTGLPATVEPALLSFTCQRLNQMRRERGLNHIDVALVQEFEGGFGLEPFYDQAFANLDPALQKWVATELITASGQRDSVSLERAEQSLRRYGLSRALVEILVSRRILRITVEGGIGRVELAHDLLLPSAMRSRNDARPVNRGAGPVSRLLGKMFGVR